MSKVQVKVANDRFPIEGSLQLAHDQLLFVSSHALTSLSVLTGTLIHTEALTLMTSSKP
jgi:hypothetical protein